jgi:hypothetical protein
MSRMLCAAPPASFPPQDVTPPRLRCLAALPQLSHLVLGCPPRRSFTQPPAWLAEADGRRGTGGLRGAVAPDWGGQRADDAASEVGGGGRADAR